jgi:hypothetical protein
MKVTGLILAMVIVTLLLLLALFALYNVPTVQPQNNYQISQLEIVDSAAPQSEQEIIQRGCNFYVVEDGELSLVSQQAGLRYQAEHINGRGYRSEESFYTQ